MIHAYQYVLRDIAGLPAKYKYSQPAFQKKVTVWYAKKH